jgi:acetyl-CoA acyltransferase
MRTAAAQEAGLFDDEISPMTVKWQKVVNKETKETEIVEGTVSSDECNRATTTLESLSNLPPVFAEDGSVTAG